MSPDEAQCAREVIDYLVSQVPRGTSTKMGPISIHPSPLGPHHARVRVQRCSSVGGLFLIEEREYEISLTARVRDARQSLSR